MSDSEHGLSGDGEPLEEDSAPDGIVSIPVGTQVLRLPVGLAAEFDNLRDGSGVHLDGTRVWLRRGIDELVLHVGDVDRSTLD